MWTATRRWLCALILVITGLLAGPAQAAELLAVLELSGALPDDQRRALTNAVREEATDVTASTIIKVMTQENMETLLTDMGLDASCISEGACEVDTLRNLQANYGVTGEVTDFGGTFLVTLQLYEMRGGTMMGAEKVKGTDALTLVTESVPVATRELLARLPGVGGAPAGASAAGATAVASVDPGSWSPSAEMLASLLPPVTEDTELESAIEPFRKVLTESPSMFAGISWRADRKAWEQAAWRGGVCAAVGSEGSSKAMESFQAQFKSPIVVTKLWASIGPAVKRGTLSKAEYKEMAPVIMEMPMVSERDVRKACE